GPTAHFMKDQPIRLAIDGNIFSPAESMAAFMGQIDQINTETGLCRVVPVSRGTWNLSPTAAGDMNVVSNGPVGITAIIGRDAFVT
ncbi:hypothetical protein, partial [Streptococcus pneumoniae]|uniref:hypothetical protein n=1 Tax=Streptococcus pneumoniae TaxID=1313 RepID=UPI0018B0E51C